MDLKTEKLGKAQRMLTILKILSSRNQSSTSELIKMFNTTERTIYRDLRDLKKMGVPVYFDNGLKLGDFDLKKWKADKR